MIKYFFSFCLFIFFVSCESPYMVRHPVSAGDTYYLYATYYGDEFEGRQAADGSTFSQSEMTCAARGFPFGTMLEVKSIATGKKVVVKVTDRPGKNVVDLSKAAFEKIDDLSKGKIRVKVKVVKRGAAQASQKRDPGSVPEKVSEQKTGHYTLQVYRFGDLEIAKEIETGLNLDCYIFAKDGFYFVRCGSFTTRKEAEQFKNEHFSDEKDAVVIEMSD